MERPPDDILKEILRKIVDEVEGPYELNVFYAVESGSRAWGFASHNSDWDVRFIYAHRPSFYMRALPMEHPIEKKGTIEMKITCRPDGSEVWVPRDDIPKPYRKDEMDLSGWDLKVVMDMIRKSNPPLLEWLESPFVYQDVRAASDILREVSKEYYSPKACMYHYLHMAEGNFQQYLSKKPVVEHKKYLYVIRPILACMWIERTEEMAPMEIQRTLEAAANRIDCYQQINDLIRAKMNGDELSYGPANPLLQDFLIRELNRLHEVLAGNKIKATYRDNGRLNEAFEAILKMIF